MFSKISYTEFRPEKPLLVWDGECPFCHYWVVQLRKITGAKVDYLPYQQIHSEISDIRASDFKEAVRLIDTGGNVYNGPETAYWCLKSGKNWGGPMKKYEHSKLFRNISDKGYSFVSKHRSAMLKLSHGLWGKDPVHTKPYWAIYLAGFIGLISALIIASAKK